MVERGLDRVEAQPEQPARDVEGGGEDVVELQVGLQRRLVEVVLLRLADRGVVAPVPRRDVVVDPVRAHELSQPLAVRLRPGARWRPDRHQEIADCFGRSRHLRLELEMCEVGVAEQPRPLLAQFEHLGDDGAIVGLAAVLAPRGPGAERPLAQVTARGELQERHDQAARQGHDVAVEPALLRRLRRRRHEVGRQAGQVVGGEGQRPALLVGQHVLPEGGPQAREPLDDLLQPRPVGAREPRAGADEHPVVQREHPLLLRSQPELGLLREEAVDAGEQACVHHRLGVVGGEARAQLALQRLDRVVGMRAGQAEEHGGDPVEGPLGPLHRLDRVAEVRRGRIAGDRVDVGARLGQRGVEGRAEVVGRDGGEGRQSERRIPVLQQRVHLRGSSVRPGADARTLGRTRGSGQAPVSVRYTPRANAWTIAW